MSFINRCITHVYNDILKRTEFLDETLQFGEVIDGSMLLVAENRDLLLLTKLWL
jgi:hypothetical protein